MEILRPLQPPGGGRLPRRGLPRPHRLRAPPPLVARRRHQDPPTPSPRRPGLSISIGIGATRAVAKIAASLAKPSGVLEVTRGEERAFLDALPLEHLPGVGPRMRRDLARFNLHTVGDLAAVPEDVLEETFGRTGTDPLPPGPRTREQRGRGPRRRDRAADPLHLPRDLLRRRTPPTTRFIDGDDLVPRPARRPALRKAGSPRARSVGVRLRYADFQTVETRRRLPRPTDDDDEILGSSHAALARTLRPAGATPPRRRGPPRPRRGRPTDSSSFRSPQVPGARPRRSPGRRRARQRSPDGWRRVRPWHAIDCVRDRHGFGSVVRGNAVASSAATTGARSHARRRLAVHPPHPPTRLHLRPSHRPRSRGHLPRLEAPRLRPSHHHSLSASSAGPSVSHVTSPAWSPSPSTPAPPHADPLVRPPRRALRVLAAGRGQSARGARRARRRRSATPRSP